MAHLDGRLVGFRWDLGYRSRSPDRFMTIVMTKEVTFSILEQTLVLVCGSCEQFVASLSSTVQS